MGVTERREREFKRREDEILSAAFILFSKKSVETVTMEMIAEKAEVGKGTIYKHFKSKNEIFAHIIIKESESVIKALRQIDDSEPVIVQIKKVLRVFWEKAVLDLESFSVYRKCEQITYMDDLSPELVTAFMNIYYLKLEKIRALIERAVREELFRDENPDTLVAVAIGMFQGVVDRILQGEVEPSEKLYGLLENMMIKGFMK